jgi:hypothetical protein
MYFKPLPMIYKLQVDKATKENRMMGNGIFLLPFEQRKAVPDKIYGKAEKDAIRYWNKFVKSKHSVGILLLGDPGSGKALEYNAPVLTPKGWVPIYKLNKGDDVIAYDGSVTKVTGVYPQGKRQLYKVTFMDNRTVNADIEHRWGVYQNKRKHHNDLVVKTTKELMEDFKNRKPHGRNYVPLFKPDFKEKNKDLPIDPYLLGVLIGDGCLTTHTTFSTADSEIIDSINNILGDDYDINNKKHDKYSYSIVYNKSHGVNPLTEQLRTLGLFGKTSYYKFIPEIYLNASPNQRLSLLQGLMDTDGTTNKKGGTSFSTSSLTLAKNTAKLVRSLGGIAKITIKQPYYKHNGIERLGMTSYKVNIRMKNLKECFRLTRKRNLLKDKNQYSDTLKLGIKSIEPVYANEAVCISVDHPSKLFVTKDYIVTHNTLIGEILANLGIDNELPVVQITETKVDLDVLSYISSMGDAIIFFDEFSKNVDYNMQSKMLTMMTDKSGGKKLFVITENERTSVSRFIVNRPGRAFYSKDYNKLEIETVIQYLNDFPVKESFKDDLLEKYKTTLVFSFDHLTALVAEHLDYPDETIDELLEYLNVDLFVKPMVYTVGKVFKTDKPDEVIEYNQTEIDAKDFAAGRNYYLSPVNHSNPGLKINDKLVVDMDDETVTLKYTDLTIVLNKITADKFQPSTNTGGRGRGLGGGPMFM